MRNNNPKKWILIAGFLLVSGGFILPFWPICVLGVLVAAFGGIPVGAVAFGLLLDLAYGAPYGLTHYLFFPFTLVALIAIAGRWVALRFMLERTAQERL
jgi:drug/metabolite transporter superfamily protein YnfA